MCCCQQHAARQLTTGSLAPASLISVPSASMGAHSRVHTAMCTSALSFFYALQSPYWLLHPSGPHGSRVLKKQALRLKTLNVFIFIYLFMLFHIYTYIHGCFACKCICVPLACLVATGPAEDMDYGTGGTGSYELTCGCWESSRTTAIALYHCTISRQPSSNF